MSTNSAIKKLKDTMSQSDLAEMMNPQGYINEILNSKMANNVKMGATLARLPLSMATMLPGLDPTMISPLLQGASGVALGAGAYKSNSNTNTALHDARARQLAINNRTATSGDTAAAAANSASNVASAGRNAAYGAFAAGNMGMGTSLLPATSLGMGSASLMGGISGLGGGASALTSGVGSIASGLGMGTLGSGLGSVSGLLAGNPMMAGIATMIAMQKGGSALGKYMKGKSSLKETTHRSVFTPRTSGVQLEEDYGQSNLYISLIRRMQNQGQMTPAEGILASLLSLIEGHTSVIPMFVGEFLDNQKKNHDIGGNGGFNNLSDTFGDDGANRVDGKTDRRKYFQELFSSLELGTANLASVFDIAGQFSNMFSGKSSVKLYNEANNKQKKVDLLQSEEEMGEKLGIATGLIQAIHMTPAQIMQSANTYEDKVLTLLGHGNEINRFSAHELLKIRVDGFGLKNSGINGYLKRLQDKNEEENLEDPGFYDRWFKSIDEILGIVPGYASLSNGIKMATNAHGWMKEQFEDTEDVGSLFTNWMTDDIKNSTLYSEEALRQSVGAVELSSAELMNEYLGKSYPERFELLLEYNLSQKESLESMAGGISRTSLEKLSMNKYTGRMMTQAGHQAKDADIVSRTEEEMNLLNESDSEYTNLFRRMMGDESIINNQNSEARKKNPFLDMMMNGDSSVNSAESAESADDIQERIQQETFKERGMSLSEQQVALLQDIRDCLNCKKSSGFEDYKKQNRQKRKQMDSNSDSMLDNIPMVLGYSGRSGNDKLPTSKKANIFKKVANFFSWKSLKRLFTTGKVFSGLLKLMSFVPILGPALAHPVLGGLVLAIGVASAAYYAGQKAMEWMSGTDSDDMDKIDTKTRDKMEKAGHDFKAKLDAHQATVNDATILLRRKKFSKDELKALGRLHRDDGVMLGAISNLLVENGMNTSFIDSDQLITYWGGNFDTGGRETFNGLSLDQKKKFMYDQKGFLRDSLSGKDLEYAKRKIKEEQAKLDKENNTLSSSYNTKTSAAGQLNSFTSNITSEYGKERDIDGTGHKKVHHGVDYAAKEGDPIYSISAGVAHIYHWSPGGNASGNSVTIIDDKGNRLQYFHLSHINVKQGRTVRRGELIGLAGNSGHSSGAHVHIQLKNRTGDYMDPSPYIDGWTSGKIKLTKTIQNPHQKQLQENKKNLAKSQSQKSSSQTLNDYNKKDKLTIDQNRQLDNIYNAYKTDGINERESQSLLAVMKMQMKNDQTSEENKKLLQQQILVLSGIHDKIQKSNTKVYTLSKLSDGEVENILKIKDVKL